jgi:hypothetical protein
MSLPDIAFVNASPFRIKSAEQLIIFYKNQFF